VAETKTERFHKEMIIGDIIDAHPDAIKVIESHFGGGCFTCPGMRVESLTFGATMHCMDPDIIVKELNELP